VRPPGAGAAKEPPEPAPQSRPRPFAARPPAPARSPEDSLSRLDDSKLKVMAIAWSNDPARRVAVVNGHILKEGESVDGYSITQIRKDDIIVREGGRSWRVEFNLKTQP
jgi:type II secretory pathway component PulC